MIPKDETFNGTWPFTPNFCNAAGFNQHYVDVGEGEVIICLHGEPTWGYLYRKMIPPLAQNNRVIVPDHMGFGKSETPMDREYTLKTHTENLASLIDSLSLSNITFVMQDWGGPIGTAYAVRFPKNIKRMVYMNTVAGYGRVSESVTPIHESPWFEWIGEGMESGRTESILRNAGSTVLSIMKIIGFQNSSVIDDDWIDAYSSPFPDYDSSIGAYEFPIDVYLGRISDYVLEGVEGVPALQAKPAILLEGLEDRAIPPDRAIEGFKSLWPDEEVIELPGVGHFCQEDAPDVLVSHILDFLSANR
tara:strand:+ start:4320 stop:5231 length:912 start_codon:yes stop_codon:yes gene_type:complete